jgi:hypothetical protein
MAFANSAREKVQCPPLQPNWRVRRFAIGYRIRKRDVAGENSMSRSPFLNDPLEQLSKHIAAAVSSPVEEVRAMHIRAAEHLSQLAKENGITRRQRHVPQRRDT